MKYQVIKCLKVLGIKYKNIFDSSLSKNEKTEQLIELNNAKELIEKFDIEEIKNLISKEKSEKISKLRKTKYIQKNI